MWGHREKNDHYETKSRLSLDTDSAGAFVVNFPASSTVKNKFLLFTSHRVSGILL